MKSKRLLRPLIIGAMVLMLTLGATQGVLAAGNYYGNKLTWTKSECTSGSWRIWRMNDNGSSQTILTQVSPAGLTDEHPVWTDDGSDIVFVRNNAIYKMNGTSGESGGLTLLASAYAHHPYVFGSKVYYVKQNGSGIREIWRMNLSNGSAKEVVLSSGTTTAGNKWHPSVASVGGKDYLVYVQGNATVNNDSLIRIYNLTDSIGPVTLLDGSTLPIGEEYNAPTITPDGTAVLYVHSISLLKKDIIKRGLNGTPMTAGDDTTTTLTTGSDDMTPYADYTASGEMDFVRIFGNEAEIYHKSGLSGTTPVPTNISNDAVNIDVKIVEQSSCNPQPVPCPTKTGTNTISQSIAGFLLIMIGSSILVWRQRRKSLNLV